MNVFVVAAITAVGGFGLGTVFGANVVSKIKQELAIGLADVKAFVSAELAKIKSVV